MLLMRMHLNEIITLRYVINPKINGHPIVNSLIVSGVVICKNDVIAVHVLDLYKGVLRPFLILGMLLAQAVIVRGDILELLRRISKAGKVPLILSFITIIS